MRNESSAPSMSEFRVAAHTIHRRRIDNVQVPLLDQPLLPAIFTENGPTSLFEKYIRRDNDNDDAAIVIAANPRLHKKKKGNGATITYGIVRTTGTTINEPRAYPNKENTVVLSQLHHSVLTGRRFVGTYYAFLMSHTLTGKKKDTNIGVSKNPVFSVIAHNNQAKVTTPDGISATSTGDVYSFPVIYDKDTASAAPFWRLNTVLGPFFTKHAAEECCHEWVKKTRGTVSKQQKAPRLARMFDCDLYTTQVSINMPIERYLYENNAPADYIRACQSIKSECRSIVGSEV